MDYIIYLMTPHRLLQVDVLLDIPFRAYYSPLINSDFDGRFNRSAMCSTPSLLPYTVL